MSEVLPFILMPIGFAFFIFYMFYMFEVLFEPKSKSKRELIIVAVLHVVFYAGFIIYLLNM